MYPIQTVEQLGPYLKSLRRARGWTQAVLAGALGVSRARVNTIERDPGAVSIAQLHRVLTALGARLAVEAAPTAGAHAGADGPAAGEASEKSHEAPAPDPSPAGEW